MLGQIRPERRLLDGFAHSTAIACFSYPFLPIPSLPALAAFSGTLEKGEVVRALVKTLCAPGEGVDVPPDVRSIQTMRSTIDAIWPIFDTDGSGSIERLEFLKPADGLADTIIATARQSG